MFLNLISYLLIPATSFLLAGDTNWLTTNFSVISISYSKQGLFLIWSVLVGGFFYFTLRRILEKLDPVFHLKKEMALLPVIVSLLSIAVLAPYLPEHFPLLSYLHVVSAFVTSVLLLLCLTSVCLKLYRFNPSRFRRFLTGLIWISCLCASLFLLSGIINSAMEILFTICSSLLVKRLYDIIVLDSR